MFSWGFCICNSIFFADRKHDNIAVILVIKMAFIEKAMASRMEASAGNNNKSTFHTTVDATFPNISRPIPVVRATKKNLRQP